MAVLLQFYAVKLNQLTDDEVKLLDELCRKSKAFDVGRTWASDLLETIGDIKLFFRLIYRPDPDVTSPRVLKKTDWEEIPFWAREYP